MSFGFRIGRERPRIDAAMVEKFRGIPVAYVSDAMLRMSAGGSRLRPIGTAAMAGPALAVKTAPGDNLMVHKALDLTKKGDILVVDAGGDLTNSILGENMLRYANKRGVAGIVINGGVRDTATLRKSHIPVFAAGITHRGPYKNGPGEINFPISIDGMVIESGDLILGDEDGILCIPFRDAEAIYTETLKREKREKAAAAGEETDRSWVDETLKRLGCEIATG